MLIGQWVNGIHNLKSLFIKHIEPWGLECLCSCNWLQLRAANGLSILYIGYLELDMILCGKVIPRCGTLVMKDPPDAASGAPGNLESNVIRRCYQDLFETYGPSLFNSPAVAWKRGFSHTQWNDEICGNYVS